jgi:hypothetical protein
MATLTPHPWRWYGLGSGRQYDDAQDGRFLINMVLVRAEDKSSLVAKGLPTRPDDRPDRFTDGQACFRKGIMPRHSEACILIGIGLQKYEYNDAGHGHIQPDWESDSGQAAVRLELTTECEQQGR